jgi:hypothetical protein
MKSGIGVGIRGWDCFGYTGSGEFRVLQETTLESRTREPESRDGKIGRAE